MITEKTLENGVVITFDYDSERRIAKMTQKPTASSSDDIVTLYYYDDYHNQTKKIIDSGKLNLTQSFEYDSFNNLTRIIERNGLI